MNCAALLNDLQHHILSAIQHGEFLLTTNQFSRAWMNDFHNTERVQTVLHGILMNFCRNYLAHHDGTYVLGNLEQYNPVNPHASTAILLTQNVVRDLNHPRLQFHKALVDPDSFEVLLDEVPEDSKLLLFVLPSVPHDLLIAACQNLAMMGHGVAGMLTPVECEHLNGPELRKALGLDFIPFMVYDSTTERISSILEMSEPLYAQYHRYFQDSTSVL